MSSVSGEGSEIEEASPRLKFGERDSVRLEVKDGLAIVRTDKVSAGARGERIRSPRKCISRAEEEICRLRNVQLHEENARLAYLLECEHAERHCILSGDYHVSEYTQTLDSDYWNSQTEVGTKSCLTNDEQLDNGFGNGFSVTAGIPKAVFSNTAVDSNANIKQDPSLTLGGIGHWQTFEDPTTNLSSTDILDLSRQGESWESLMLSSAVPQQQVVSSSYAISNIAQNYFLDHNPFDHTGWDTICDAGLDDPQSAQPSEPQMQNTQMLVYPFHEIPVARTRPTQLQPPMARTPALLCTHDECTKTFERKSDRARHSRTVHGVNRVLHFCPIQGCPKSQGHGQGYSRDDKVTEHLWKKHENLGYTKSR